MQIEWCVALRRSGKSTRCTDLEKCDTRCSRNSSEAGPKSYNAPLDSSLVSRPPLRSYEYPRISKHFSYYPYLLLISTTHEIFPSHAYRVIIRLQQSRYLCLYRANTSNIYIYRCIFLFYALMRIRRLIEILRILLGFFFPYDQKWRRQNRIENWVKTSCFQRSLSIFNVYIFLNQNTITK